jgi:L-alanine-DL-glutamate epimerase-like enolase superfamily enzyme
LGPPFALENGTILAPEGPGLGVPVDEGLIARYPFIKGASYVR